ncbi:major histocompatibility complex class I-related protein 1-like [Halichoeres trimaculatus]|uniref:major histocompatibility complex class I-related protein 1-like n=1 Tax=Halichoeres trimaculatus TaxID=147232 RepID=UPI003D9E6AEC
MVHSARQLFNHTEGVHVLQMIGGIEFDDETGDFDYVMKFGYDGEDFLSVDLMTLTLTFHKPEPTTEKMYVGTVKSSQPRTVLPSVSLLQRSPSSPVTCHATGFFPDRAVMFWRRDGEELQEEVYHGEILPNHNRTFQMSVKLNISSVPPEDWGKYEYVFQLFGEKEDMVTKLHKDVIRTNHAARHYLTTIIIVICAIIGVCGFIMARAAHKYRRAPHSESTLSPLNSLRD